MLKRLAFGAGLIAVVLGASACTHNKENARLAAQERETAKMAALDQEVVICKEYIETASRLRKQKVCRTRAQWAELEKSSKDFVKDIERRGAAQPGGDSLGP